MTESDRNDFKTAVKFDENTWKNEFRTQQKWSDTALKNIVEQLT